jgi:hypothetical protein
MEKQEWTKPVLEKTSLEETESRVGVDHDGVSDDS